MEREKEKSETAIAQLIKEWGLPATWVARHILGKSARALRHQIKGQRKEQVSPVQTSPEAIARMRKLNAALDKIAINKPSGDKQKEDTTCD